MLLIAIISQMLRGISGVSSWRRKKGKDVLKVFMAGPYPWKERLKTHAASLNSRGITVVSEWLYEPPGKTFQELEPSEARVLANRDLENIRDCDIFVYFCGDTGGGGKDFEMGYAHYIAKEILVIGTPRNIYHFLPECVFCDNWASARELIVELSDCKLEWLDNNNNE